MGIRDWPAGERPREKLLERGAAALSDAELVAIFLRVGTRGMSAVDLARSMLQHFDGLRGLLNSDEKSFCALKGLGKTKYVQLQAALEMGRRHLHSSMMRNDTLSNPADARHYLQMRLRDQHREVFACLYLDNRHRVLEYEELFFGTIDGASVHPREVVKNALSHNAAALILAHNHPSGVAEPSRADEQITRHLKEALALVDIRVLDHLIIGDGAHTSLAERGLL